MAPRGFKENGLHGNMKAVHDAMLLKLFMKTRKQQIPQINALLKSELRIATDSKKIRDQLSKVGSNFRKSINEKSDVFPDGLVKFKNDQQRQRVAVYVATPRFSVPFSSSVEEMLLEFEKDNHLPMIISNNRIPVDELVSKLPENIECNWVTVQKLKSGLVLQNSDPTTVKVIETFDFTKNWDISCIEPPERVYYKLYGDIQAKFAYSQGIDTVTTDTGDNNKLGELCEQMMPGFKVPKDVLEHCSESKVFGVNVAQLYLGGKGSAFAAHIEDLNLSSMVSVTTGQKIFFLIRRHHYGKFIKSIIKPMTTEATEKHFINDCGVSMKHRMIIPSLEELHKYDIDYDLVRVNAGQTLIIPSGIIHFGFNVVTTSSFSVNFADSTWAKSLPNWVRQPIIRYPKNDPIFEVDGSACTPCKKQFKNMHKNLGISALTDNSIEKYLSERKKPKIMSAK